MTFFWTWYVLGITHASATAGSICLYEEWFRVGQPENVILQGWFACYSPGFLREERSLPSGRDHLFLIYFLPSVVHAQMVDEANTKLMRDYVLETSDIEDDKRWYAMAPEHIFRPCMMLSIDRHIWHMHTHIIWLSFCIKSHMWRFIHVLLYMGINALPLFDVKFICDTY